MTLFLARHGQTDQNAAGLVQGRGLDPDLNATGRAQAEALAAALGDTPLDAVYVSTQRRSQQTAEPTLAAHPEARLVVRSGLDEMDWGAHEGKGHTPDSEDTAMAAAYEDLNRRWDAGETDLHVRGGESPDEVWARVQPVLAEIGAAFPGGRVLVVSHRRLLRVLVAGALPGGGLERMSRYPHDNAALSTLDVPGGTFGPDARLVTFADVSFLAGTGE